MPTDCRWAFQGPLSVARIYRDALSGALMVSNERIAAKSASMLLVVKDSL